MKHKAVVIGLFFGLFLSPVALMAQQEQGSRHALALHVGISMPVGGSYISETSFGSSSLSYLYRSSALFEQGLSVGFIGGRKSGTDQLRFGSDLVSGNSERRLTLIPLQGEFRYFPFGKRNFALQPYVAVAAGWQYAQFYITADAIQTMVKKNGAFVATPQIGVRANPHRGRLFFDARVMWHYGGNEWQEAHTASQQGLGVQIGVGIKL